MITNKDIQNAQLSPTKKDYYQIWNELLEVSKKLSDRWDPTSTNESDPGIVLLKVLTGIADKLNYNIDKNILEAYPTSATQEESMRKICDMLGYNIKYYQSAISNVSIAYNRKNANGTKFITNDTENNEVTSITIPMFTSISDADGTINYVTLEPCTLSPANEFESISCIEGQLAICETENNNIISINNLDTNNRYFLPETQIAENGLFVYSINNNITSQRWETVQNLNTQSLGEQVYKFGYSSKERLPYIQFPDDIGNLINDGLLIYYIRTNGVNGNISAKTLSKIDAFWENNQFNVDDFFVCNYSASTNGKNIETINAAYNGFKKTIGTFDTLVTCRDYMNAIYNLVNEVDNITPLVSNCIASDIRDDINKAYTLCSFNDYGICYKHKAVKTNNTELEKINHFDLVLYPFKVYKTDTKVSYNNSFKYSGENYNEICAGLEDLKTTSHNIILPDNSEIAAIKVMLKLNATITTISKVNDIEANDILSNIYTAIYRDFNMRNIDFGEEIPYESILTCIENADERIKNVALDEPETSIDYEVVGNTVANKESQYLQIIALNVLAGRLPLFEYSKLQNYAYNEEAAKLVDEKNIIQNIKTIKSNFKLNVNTINNDTTLLANQVLEFRAPNFITEITYPAYVNYYLHLNAEGSKGIPATMMSLSNFMTDANWEEFINQAAPAYIFEVEAPEEKVAEWASKFQKLFTINDDDQYVIVNVENIEAGQKYYNIDLSADTFPAWDNWIKTKQNTVSNIDHLYVSLGYNGTNIIGRLVDAEKIKYQARNTYATSTKNPLDSYFVPISHGEQTQEYTMDGLGKDADLTDGIPMNCDYQLKDEEYLLINYTDSSDNIKQLYYGKDTIIRPNFVLADTDFIRTNSSKSWSKSSGILPDWDGGITYGKHIESLDGMYSLGANEQIEIRKIAIVELKKKDSDIGLTNYNFYWIPENRKFTDGNSIVLEDGEYFFYTNRDKTSFAYYGSGTEIKAVGKTLQLENFANEDNTEVDMEDILENGITSIPWTTIAFNAEQSVKITEYQYITLTENNKLTSLELDDSSTDTEITSDSWTDIKNATYVIDDESKVLPKLEVNNYKWKLRSRLTLDFGPAKVQAIKENCSLQVTDINDITNNIIGSDTLCIKADTLIKSNLITTDCAIKQYNITTGKIESAYNNTLYGVTEHAVTIDGSDNEPQKVVNLNNLNNIWTKIAASDIGLNNKLTLHTNIPANKYGLIMMYVIGDSDMDDHIYLTADGAALTLFNDRAWHKIDDQNYYLHNGINIIKVPYGTTSIHIHPVAAGTGVDNCTLIFSQLDIVDGINKVFGNIDNNKLLEEISEKDTDFKFYYNCPIENSTAINISNDELFSSPKFLYDYNNIVNKFVVSEIDADSLVNGIKIAKSSRK